MPLVAQRGYQVVKQRLDLVVYAKGLEYGKTHGQQRHHGK